jgi:RsiW-degrading membrane proteinase PrsW (M82 family)
MSSSASEELPQTKDNRSRMSNPNSPTILQAMEIQTISTKSTEKIHRYYIWSIFNLLFLPFGLLCCYFSYRVDQFKAQNRYEMAIKWSKRTFILNIMTTLLMAGVIITVVMLRYDYIQRNLASEVNQTLTTIAYIPWQPGR